MSARETAVVTALLNALDRSPLVAFAMRANAGKITTISGHQLRLAPAGTADIIGCTFTGTFFCFEVKVEDNPLTPDQTKFLRRINKTGAVARVFRLPFADGETIDQHLEAITEVSNGLLRFSIYDFEEYEDPKVVEARRNLASEWLGADEWPGRQQRKLSEEDN